MNFDRDHFINIVYFYSQVKKTVLMVKYLLLYRNRAKTVLPNAFMGVFFELVLSILSHKYLSHTTYLDFIIAILTSGQCPLSTEIK